MENSAQAVKKLSEVAEKLLDLGKTNQLINLKTNGGRAVELLLPDTDALFKTLTGEGTLSFVIPGGDSEGNQSQTDEKSAEEIAQEIATEDGSDAKAEASSDGKADQVSENTQNTPQNGAQSARRATKAETLGIGLSRDAFLAKYGSLVKRGKVLAYTSNTKRGVADILSQIIKVGKSSLEENGVNVLFAAFGIISWHEKEGDSRVYKAPLLLIPVVLEKTGGLLSGFKVRGNDDDVIVNPTFVLKMHREFKLDLPEFGAEDTLESYFERARAILAKAKFELSAEAALGVFSFVKISMYQDLMEHQAEILKNADVRALLGEAEPEQAELDNMAAQDDSDNNPLISMHNVVDADATQLAAIKAAASGRSFVLQGPPGTGKSQTITNIIAEILAQGRRVLFVSEKQAALQVVYNKMRKAGLEDFCLEIHSSKVSKKDVINEVCRTLQLNKIHTTEKAERDSSRRCDLINELEGYEHELHATIPELHCSLFQLYEDFWKLADKVKSVPDAAFYEISDVTSKDLDYCDRVVTELQKFGSYAEKFGDGSDVRKNPWYGLNVNCQTEASRRSFFAVLDRLASESSKLASLMGDFAENGFNSDLSLEGLHILLKTSSMLEGARFATLSDLENGGARLAEVLRAVGAEGRELSKLYGELASISDGDFMNFKAAETEVALKNSYSGGVSRFFSSLLGGEYKKLISSLAALRRDRKAPAYEEALEMCQKLTLLQNKAREFTGKVSAFTFPELSSNGFNADWNALSSELMQINDFAKLKLFDAAPSELEATTDTSLASQNLGNKEELLDKLLKKANSIYTSVCEYWEGDGFKEILNDFAADGVNLATISLKALNAKAQGAIARSDQFDSWREFGAVLSYIANENLTDFVFNYAEAGGTPKLIADYYRYSWTRGRIEAVLAANPVLAAFSATEHARAIGEFKNLDKNIFKINCVYIKSALLAQKPDLEALVPSSPVFQILREGQKKTRQMGVRDFMTKFGDTVMEVKPCFLMSPLSVSSYLKPECGLFDAVIFDEASQIFAQDALGAIYRGKQVIVVGDSRQMPPSNFFGASIDGDLEEDVTDISSFESILDLCAGSFRNLQLNWHYRSRFEELIAFSNKFIYEGRLVSFPAAAAKTVWNGVSFRFVPDAVYTQNTNVKEAEAVVQAVFENLTKYPDRTLGVVTFSIKQQALIERLIEQERLRRPEFEEYFAASREEPFFVKNLETVQGDERDTIIFSITFGRDPQGRFSRNFGPLSRDGGERRLNVAVTRAKKSVQVVSSIHATDIDIKGLSFRGAELLHHYLDFAERGPVALEAQLSAGKSDWFDSPFEEDVATFLRNNGYTVDTQVGCSNYRIDLGLRRPESSDYLLAIECDGRTYHSTKNARDRDRLRQSVLEGMGWIFYRIWSTDWFRNNAAARRSLLAAVKSAVEHGSIPSGGTPKPTEVATTPIETTSSTKGGAEKPLADEKPQGDTEVLRDAEVKDEGKPIQGNQEAGSNPDSNHATSEGANVATSVASNTSTKLGDSSASSSSSSSDEEYGEEVASQNKSLFETFQAAEERPIRIESATYLAEAAVSIMEVEGPVSEDLLFKRLSVACGHTTRLSETFKRVANQAYKTSQIKNMGIKRTTYGQGADSVSFWSLENSVPKFHIPASKENRRDISAISPLELAQGMEELIAINKTCGRLELYKRLYTELGYMKLTDKAIKYFDWALSELSPESRACVDLKG